MAESPNSVSIAQTDIDTRTWCANEISAGYGSIGGCDRYGVVTTKAYGLDDPVEVT